jgi:hypothetical protein
MGSREPAIEAGDTFEILGEIPRASGGGVLTFDIIYDPNPNFQLAGFPSAGGYESQRLGLVQVPDTDDWEFAQTVKLPATASGLFTVQVAYAAVNAVHHKLVFQCVDGLSVSGTELKDRNNKPGAQASLTSGGVVAVLVIFLVLVALGITACCLYNKAHPNSEVAVAAEAAASKTIDYVRHAGDKIFQRGARGSTRRTQQGQFTAVGGDDSEMYWGEGSDDEVAGTSEMKPLRRLPPDKDKQPRGLDDPSSSPQFSDGGGNEEERKNSEEEDDEFGPLKKVRVVQMTGLPPKIPPTTNTITSKFRLTK